MSARLYGALSAIKVRPLRLIALIAMFLCAGGVMGCVALAFLAERFQEVLSDDRMTYDLDKVPQAEVGLVLGTSPVLPTYRIPNPFFYNRLEAAAALWKAGKVKYLIVSGNHRSPRYDETAVMRADLISRGVPASAIYRDGKGVRTWDSVVRARDIFGLKQMIVVSQRAHVARALFLARSLGMEAWGLEASEDDIPMDARSRLRPYPAAVLSYYDAWRGFLPGTDEPRVSIGVDPPG